MDISVEWIIAWGAIGVTGLVWSTLLIYRQQRQMINKLALKVREAEFDLFADIQAIGVEELETTQAGRTLLEMECLPSDELGTATDRQDHQPINTLNRFSAGSVWGTTLLETKQTGKDFSRFFNPFPLQTSGIRNAVDRRPAFVRKIDIILRVLFGKEEVSLKNLRPRRTYYIAMSEKLDIPAFLRNRRTHPRNPNDRPNQTRDNPAETKPR